MLLLIIISMCVCSAMPSTFLIAQWCSTSSPSSSRLCALLVVLEYVLKRHHRSDGDKINDVENKFVFLQVVCDHEVTSARMRCILTATLVSALRAAESPVRAGWRRSIVFDGRAFARRQSTEAVVSAGQDEQ